MVKRFVELQPQEGACGVREDGLIVTDEEE